MSTLRNPTKHFLHSFLHSKVADKLSHSGAKDTVKLQLQVEMKKLAKLSEDLRRLQLYKSDWKNNIALMWSERRRKLLDGYRQSIGRFDYGPAQWDIAIDLYPQAHPFAYTYGRRGGYALPDKYEDSFQWLLRHANAEEKAYFVYLLSLEQLPIVLEYLSVLPASIRDQAKRTATALMTYDTAHGDEASVNRVIRMIDEWCRSQDSVESAVDVACRDFIALKKHSLPTHLKNRIPAMNQLNCRNVVALFDLVLSTYDGPIALLSQLTKN